MNPAQDESASAVRVLRTIGEGLSRLGLALAAMALLVVILFNFVNVVLRYVFLHSLPWAEELMLYLMIFAVYAGAVSVAWEQRHIRLAGVLNFAPPRFRRALEIFSSLVLVGILCPIVYSSATVVSFLFEFGEHSDALEAPMWIPQSVIPAALGMIALIAVVRIIVPDLAPRRIAYDDIERI